MTLGSGLLASGAVTPMTTRRSLRLAYAVTLVSLIAPVVLANLL